MKTIGMIGGMSWESSLEYYRIVNEEVHARLGGVHSAKCLIFSVDFAEIEEQQRHGEWDRATQGMIDAAQALERGGADFVVICTNTMHKMADEVEASVKIPLLHIADVAAQEVRRLGLKKIGLLGTRFTMEEAFYKKRLAEKFGLQVLIPNAADREIVHRVIYDELVLGKIVPPPKRNICASSLVCRRRAVRASFWVVPRSGCWCSRRIARCHSSTPPCSMPKQRSISPWHS